MTYLLELGYRRGMKRLLLLLVVFVLAVSGEVLSPGWYADAPVVDSQSSDFKLVIEWVKAKAQVGEPQIVAEKFEMPYTTVRSSLAPHVLVFACGNGKSATVDAVRTYQWPEISVLDIQRACGWALVYPGKYSKPEPPPPPTVQPVKPVVLVGAVIPGTDWYGVVPGDDSPDGSVYKDERGAFIKVVRVTPFGKTTYWRLIKF